MFLDDTSARERIAAGSTNVDDYLECSQLAFFRGESDESCRVLDQALALNLKPEERGEVLLNRAQQTFHKLGVCSETLGYAEEAFSLLDGQTILRPQFAEGAALLAHLILDADPARAELLRSRALAAIEEYVNGSEPDREWAYSLRVAAARCHRDAGQLERAVEWIPRGWLKEFGARGVDAMVWLARDLRLLRRFDEAESILIEAETCLAKNVIRTSHDWWENEIKVELGYVWIDRGEYAKAREMFARLLEGLSESDPRYWLYLLYLAHCEGHFERYETSCELVRKVIAGTSDPRLGEGATEDLRNMRHQKAQRLHDQGRNAEAIQELREMLAENQPEPTLSRLLFLLGRIYSFPDVKRYKESCELLEMVMQSSPEERTREMARQELQYARHSSASADYSAGKYHAAIQQFDALLADGVEGKLRDEGMLFKAAALVRTKEYRRAERCYQELLDTPQTEPAIRVKATEYLETLRREYLRN